MATIFDLRMEKEQAEYWIYLACGTAILSGIISTYRIFFTITGEISLGILDATLLGAAAPSGIATVILIFLLGIAILKFRRAASILLFIYWIFGKAYYLMLFGYFSGVGSTIGVAILIAFVFWKAIQAAFSLHNLETD